MKKGKNFLNIYKHHFSVLIVMIIITIFSGYVAFFSNKESSGQSFIVEPSPVGEVISESIQNIPNRESKLQRSVDKSKTKKEPPKVKAIASDTQSQKLQFELGRQELILSSLTIDNAVYQVFVPKGSSLYDMMKLASQTYGFSFKGKEYPGVGFFVEEIAGKTQNSKEGMYWIYYINDKKATVGVSGYIVQPGDAITWRYESMD